MKLNKIILSGTVPNFGLLLLRIGIGIMFIIHGFPKILSGPPAWEFLGIQMQIIGISFGFTFWGFMAALSESLGGLLLIFGLFTRPAAFMMFFTMLMAALMHLTNGDGIKGASHAIEMGIVFIALMFAGAGKFSLDNLIFRKK